MRPRVLPLFVLLFLTVLLAVACARGSSELYGWRAMQPGMELRALQGGGPQGEMILALLYTIIPGRDYAIERRMPIPGLAGQPELRLWARSTRVLHLAVVLVEAGGQEHECALTLLPGDWRELYFHDFRPAIDDWAVVATLRFVDRSGGLGGQGPVSLKLVGLPL